jgi:hypothetical protein
MVFDGLEQVFRSFLINCQPVSGGVDYEDTISDVRLHLAVSTTVLVSDPVHRTKGDLDMTIPEMTRWPVRQEMNRLGRDDDFSRHELETLASRAAAGKVAVTDELKVSQGHVRSLGELCSVVGNS